MKACFTSFCNPSHTLSLSSLSFWFGLQDLFLPCAGKGCLLMFMSPSTNTLFTMVARQLIDAIPAHCVLIICSQLSPTEAQIHFRKPTPTNFRHWTEAPGLQVMSPYSQQADVTMCQVRTSSSWWTVSHWRCLSSSVRCRSSLQWLYFWLRHSLKRDAAVYCGVISFVHAESSPSIPS